MSERSEQVHRLLAAMARHADLIGEAIEGAVHAGADKQRNGGIETLFDLGIIKPYDENEYRLNPRLREFFAEHFSNYNAFQSLRRISSTMQQAHEQWRELRRLKVSGATKDAHHLHVALDESVADMAYAIEHNLTMLHSLLSTQYGNVSDFKLKLRQNQYYSRQVAQFLRDVEGIDAFVQRISDEATACGLGDVRRMVVRRLAAKILNWTSQIKDAQQLISKRLFEARVMEQRLKLLARFSLHLNRHKTSDGWDIDEDAIEAFAAIALYRPESMSIRPQLDVSRSDTLIEEAMMAAVSKMPPKKSTSTNSSDSQDALSQMLLEDDEDDFVVESDPIQVIFEGLIGTLSNAKGSVSLLKWKRDRDDLAMLSDEAWLMYSSTQLRAQGVELTFVKDGQTDPFPINEPFMDVTALWRHDHGRADARMT